MKDLIEALTIFMKYQNLEFPTHCEHDEFNVVGIRQDEVSKEDKKRLKQLGFQYSESNESWLSYRFGSA